MESSLYYSSLTCPIDRVSFGSQRQYRPSWLRYRLDRQSAARGTFPVMGEREKVVAGDVDPSP